MKTFKLFLESSKKYPPTLEISFGSFLHKLKEDTYKKQITVPDVEEEEHIHRNNEVPEHGAVFQYTGKSNELNSGLYALHKAGDDTAVSLYKPLINDLDKHLAGHTIKASTTLYTGLRHAPHEEWERTKSDVSKPLQMHVPAFLSTSTNIDVAKSFSKDLKPANPRMHPAANKDKPDRIGASKHILKLTVPAGTSGGSVRNQSHKPEENEFLLNRGHDILVHPRPTIHPKDGTHIWHGTIVGRNAQEI